MSKISRSISKTLHQHAISLAIICLVLGFATTAFAVPPEEVFQTDGPLNFNGPCCFSFDVGITVTEPARPVPVVVTWEVHVFESSGANVGLIVNGGPCMAYGNGSISNFSDPSPRTFQWIVFPGDGLRAGSNSFTLCGGGVFGDSKFLDITEMTLAARLSN